MLGILAKNSQTFIEFMEQNSKQKTLEEMLDYLS
jgi:hypothetical protein